MKGFFEEFKAFAIKGNIVDLAVAVVIGTAFGKIITSFVNNMVMPFVGILLGGVDFNDLTVAVGDAVLLYGTFLQSIVDFVIVAFMVFLALKFITRLQAKEAAKPAEEKAVTPPEDVLLLREIRDAVKR